MLPIVTQCYSVKMAAAIVRAKAAVSKINSFESFTPSVISLEAFERGDAVNTKFKDELEINLSREIITPLLLKNLYY